MCSSCRRIRSQLPLPSSSKCLSLLGNITVSLLFSSLKNLFTNILVFLLLRVMGPKGLAKQVFNFSRHKLIYNYYDSSEHLGISKVVRGYKKRINRICGSFCSEILQFIQREGNIYNKDNANFHKVRALILHFH